jgi:hypothetical protein
MGWLSTFNIIAKLFNKFLGYFIIKKSIERDIMKESLDDIHISNEVKKKYSAITGWRKRDKLREYTKK